MEVNINDNGNHANDNSNENYINSNDDDFLPMAIPTVMIIEMTIVMVRIIFLKAP